MNLNEFNDSVNLLKSVYGANAYPEARVRGLWHEFSHLPDGVFAMASRAAIDEEKSAPLKKTLAGYVDVETRKRRESLAQTQSRESVFVQDWPSKWPAYLEALMRMIDKNKTGNGTGFNYGLKYSKISENDAWELFEFWKTRDWANQKATAVINKIVQARG